MKKIRMLTAMAALATLTACDNTYFESHKAERGNRDYQKAMADYQAGRLEESLKGFRAALASDPGNTSARFQYACLLQDFAHDPIEAAYAYHEFLLQAPKSDKAKLAKDRLATCEREFPKRFSIKYNLKEGEAVREVEVLRGEFKNADDRCRRLEKELASQSDQLRSLTEERDRLMKMIKGVGEGEVTAAPTVKDAKALLDEDESLAANAAPKSEEIAKLKAEGVEDLASASPLLPAQAPDAKEKRAAAEAAAKAEYERRHATLPHPDSYVVQEGDTLYKIAVKFYGRFGAWQKIRDANKAIISSDGRVKTGTRIKLPK